MDTTYTHRRRDRAIGPYDYMRRGESFKKDGCRIGSEAVFNERGHSEV